MAESNGRRNGRMTGMAGMAKRQKEWQNGRMAEMDTYVIFMVQPTPTPTPTTLKSFITETVFYYIPNLSCYIYGMYTLLTTTPTTPTAFKSFRCTDPC